MIYLIYLVFMQHALPLYFLDHHHFGTRSSTHTHTKWMSNRSAKLCMFSMLCVYLLLFWSSFIIVIIFHSFVFVFPIIFVDASFVELLGSWELIYRFVVGSRNTVCVQCLRGECIECSVLLYSGIQAINSILLKKWTQNKHEYCAANCKIYRSSYLSYKWWWSRRKYFRSSKMLILCKIRFKFLANDREEKK